MVSTEPTKAYVFQPFGMSHKENWDADRVFGVGTPYLGVLFEVKGLTKQEAEAVRDVLNDLNPDWSDHDKG